MSITYKSIDCTNKGGPSLVNVSSILCNYTVDMELAEQIAKHLKAINQCYHLPMLKKVNVNTDDMTFEVVEGAIFVEAFKIAFKDDKSKMGLIHCVLIHDDHIDAAKQCTALASTGIKVVEKVAEVVIEKSVDTPAIENHVIVEQEIETPEVEDHMVAEATVFETPVEPQQPKPAPKNIGYSITPEEQQLVVSLLRNGGGIAAQATLATQYGWSKAKINKVFKAKR